MLHLMSVTKMSQPPKSPKKCERTQNVMLKGVSSFLKQLTIASVTASLYAMTFVAFVSLCATLALCCDPIHLGKVPSRIMPVLAHVTNVPQEGYIPIIHAKKSARVPDLACGFSKTVAIAFGGMTIAIYLISWFFRYFTN